MRGLDDYSLDHIFQGTPYHIPNTAPSAPPAPVIMTAQERYFMDDFQATLSNLLTDEDNEEVADKSRY